ncbi:Zn-dependent hydrolase [Halobacillus halophilus]|uniref:Allantoate amidohydrolase n=1 Tax=Halobacillus halophilus (strain ATCC 35676 / DSM 2266 / JCM 20832 / KCTC 3685 / LMG 17431 / NBRC 102448 / NCIMB 2269) TaxID=866895 RepID=I0JKS2_HALH3|nr:Zn-dependent hydrolase [Halobacillus halophilus]ASF38873.1 Zn-dependent hydrolase [Halobacillus halophilus]CCG44742.1 allantoate amidohydrolase [Halobacillus halophilus DSM 2266]
MEHVNTINEERLFRMLSKSSETGAIPENGLRRLALSDKDQEMRNIFKEWCNEAGLTLRVDDLGNMYASREGKKDLPPVVLGSHLDTQPAGGRFDGVLGVLLALEVIHTLNDNGIETERPLEIVNFTNEEGARFEPPMLGSGGIAGVFDQDYVYSRKDADGFRFLEELERIGYKGEKENRLGDFHSFLELHIEQGPILEDENKQIGVVEGVQGINWLEVTITGEADHAGPTPMHLRKDALMAAAEIMNQLEKEITTTDVTVTVGKISVSPNSVNCVPGEAHFTVDIRSANDDLRKEAFEGTMNTIRRVSQNRDVGVEMTELWETEKIDFDRSITEVIENSATELGYSSKRMLSGAGHDAKYVNNLGPTAMIFVPSVNGKSHVPSELTLDQDIVSGANTLYHTVLTLSNE